MNRKRIIALVLCLGFVLAFAGMAVAKDVVLEGKLTAVMNATDRNGNPYVRAIITEERELNGVKYSAGVPLMFFGEHVAKGQTLQAGDTIKCIASSRNWMGRPSYTYLSAIE